MNAMAHDLAANGRRLLETEKLASLGKLAAGIAHEVNNPLAAISGYAQVLERSLVNLSIFEKNPELAADLGRIHSEVERCRAIVAGLLDLARPPRLSLFPVDLLELVEDTRRALEAAGHRCDLTVVAPDTPLPELEVDPSKIRQVLFNVLKNAAEAGSPVVLDIACTPEAMTLTVTDSGPGLDPAIEANLFEPFRTTKPNGTGLGLAVSRALARAHGGDLIALPAPPRTSRQSAPHGTGASFALTLPRVASATGVTA
jgi:signal transduction histidine kinase